MKDAFQSLANADVESLLPLLQGGPVLQLAYHAGHPTGATGLFDVHAPVDTLWRTAGHIERFPDLIAMVDSTKPLPRTRSGQEAVRVTLRFKLAFFSVKFHFDAAVTRDESGHRMELHWLAGNVKDVVIRAEAVPVSDDRCVLLVHVGFDPLSLGWLVKAFLKHHPEIEGGVHAGAVVTLGMAAGEQAEKEFGARR
ncbi:MAG: putative membrane protein [Myxococcota bacterium]